MKSKYSDLPVLSAFANAKQLQQERAAKAKAAADSPAAAVSVTRDARVATTRAWEAVQHAAAEATAVAAQAAALKAEHHAREADYDERIEKQGALEAQLQAARERYDAARKAEKRKGR
jgi:hypothetical protein